VGEPIAFSRDDRRIGMAKKLIHGGQTFVIIVRKHISVMMAPPG
jgi:hypothetical protein